MTSAGLRSSAIRRAPTPIAIVAPAAAVTFHSACRGAALGLRGVASCGVRVDGSFRRMAPLAAGVAARVAASELGSAPGIERRPERPVMIPDGAAYGSSSAARSSIVAKRFEADLLRAMRTAASTLAARFGFLPERATSRVRI